MLSKMNISIFSNRKYFLLRRIRDNMTEKDVQIKIKQVDAVHFALGVILTMFIEYIVLARPEYYPYLFYTLMPYMMVYRFNSYRAIKEHFFMLDFWYVYILGCVPQTFQ